jgi:hypothetical protein
MEDLFIIVVRQHHNSGFWTLDSELTHHSSAPILADISAISAVTVAWRMLL